MLSEIEKNPPMSVTRFVYTVEAIEMYRGLYRDITSNGVILQYNDRHALGELAVTMLECELLREELYTTGDAMSVNGDKGNQVTKKNPARDALEKIRPKMLQLMKEFKMTPASRNVKATQGGQGTGGDNEFNNF